MNKQPKIHVHHDPERGTTWLILPGGGRRYFEGVVEATRRGAELAERVDLIVYETFKKGQRPRTRRRPLP